MSVSPPGNAAHGCMLVKYEHFYYIFVVICHGSTLQHTCMYFIIPNPSVSFCVCICSSHLHKKTFVMAASTFRDKLIFEASSLLVQLHDGILPTRCQYGTLSSHLQGEEVIEVM